MHQKNTHPFFYFLNNVFLLSVCVWVFFVGVVFKNKRSTVPPGRLETRGSNHKSWQIPSAAARRCRRAASATCAAELRRRWHVEPLFDAMKILTEKLKVQQ